MRLGDGELPAGWAARRTGDCWLITERAHAAEFAAREFDRPRTWQRLIAAAPSCAGRGGSARVELAAGMVARLKPLLRGGLAGRLRSERFAGPSRALDNIRLPLAAAERGVRTPAPLALLLERVPGGWRAWLAVQQVDGGEDLGRALATHGASAIEFGAVTAAIRAAHDAGLEHRDLNVGNLLLVPPSGSSTVVWVLDLDRARLHDGSLGFARRQRGLRRLERSIEKSQAAGAETGSLRERLYESYAAGDAALATRLERGRPWGRLAIAAHRLGWRRG